MMMYHQTKFGCQRINSSVFWSYEPLMWPWPWRLQQQQQQNSVGHSASWCCSTIPHLVTKCSAIQKISSGQTFINILNLCCDLDLKCSNPIFPQHTPAYDAVLSNQVWLQTDLQFRRYNSHILIIVSWYFEQSQPQWITSRLQKLFNLSPIHFACKSSNHKLSINRKASPDTNLHETKHTQTSNTNFLKN